MLLLDCHKPITIAMFYQPSLFLLAHIKEGRVLYRTVLLLPQYREGVPLCLFIHMLLHFFSLIL